MRFLVDENLPRSIAESVARTPFEAIWVGDLLHGEPDGVIMERLRQSGELLVTRDVRFANMVGASMASSSDLGGVVLIREQNPGWMLRIWISFLSDPGTVEGLVVLTRKGIRRHRFG